MLVNSVAAVSAAEFFSLFPLNDFELTRLDTTRAH